MKQCADEKVVEDPALSYADALVHCNGGRRLGDDGNHLVMDYPGRGEVVKKRIALKSCADKIVVEHVVENTVTDIFILLQMAIGSWASRP